MIKITGLDSDQKDLLEQMHEFQSLDEYEKWTNNLNTVDLNEVVLLEAAMAISMFRDTAVDFRTMPVVMQTVYEKL